MFFAFNLTAQSDSIVHHYPKTMPCTGIKLYHNDVLVSTQVLTPNTTIIDYAPLGYTVNPSDSYLDYIMLIIDFNQLITPTENIYIEPINCSTPVELYTNVFNNKINN